MVSKTMKPAKLRNQMRTCNMHSESFYISGLTTFLHKTYIICICSEKVVAADEWDHIYYERNNVYTYLSHSYHWCTDHVIEPLL